MVNCILDQLFCLNFQNDLILDLRGKRRYSDTAWTNGPDPRFKREEEKEIFGFSMEKLCGS
jgi:hypothetical protein